MKQTIESTKILIKIISDQLDYACLHIEMLHGRANSLRKQLCDAEMFIEKLRTLEMKQETKEQG